MRWAASFWPVIRKSKAKISLGYYISDARVVRVFRTHKQKDFEGSHDSEEKQTLVCEIWPSERRSDVGLLLYSPAYAIESRFNERLICRGKSHSRLFCIVPLCGFFGS